MSGTANSFHVANGLIVGPNGQSFVAKGINIRWDQLNAAVGDGTNMPLLTDFPGLNMVRLNYENGTSPYDDPSSIVAAVNALTAKGVVVEIEDHTGISATPYTGSALAAEQAWYSTLATTFKDNPYVWFGTYNEPGNGTNLAGIAAQELATYNTIRATGNNNPVLMEEPSGGNPGTVGANATGYDQAGPMTPSDYSTMTNIVWDLHYYGWVSKYSTDQATVSAGLTGSASSASGIAGAQTITSADGTVPVIIGEFGNSTTGGAIDVNGDQVIQAVADSGKGFLAWGWDPDEEGDQLTTDSGQMTTYGNQIAAIIGSTPATAPTTTGTAASTPAPAPTPAPTATTAATGNELTPTSGGTLTDSTGNKWTLTSNGVIDENGSAIPGGSGTAALAVVNNVVYGQDASTKSWYTYSPASKTWTSAAAPVLTTPTPAPTPAPTPTATPTPAPTPMPTATSTIKELTPTSGGTLTDTAGNKWTLTSNGVVDENGSAVPGGTGTAALAVVNNVVYGQDASTKSWYTYSPANKTWTSAAAPVLTATSINIAATQSSATVSQSQVSVNATSGNHILFISGSGDTVNLAGGKETITDTGNGNTYVIPAAGKGYDTFTNNVLASGDKLDLRTALAATNWNGSTSTLSKYLSVANTSQGAVLSISPVAGGKGVGIATIDGATGTTLTSLLTHSIT